MLSVEPVQHLARQVCSVDKLPSTEQVRDASRYDRAGYWRGNYYVTRYRGTTDDSFTAQRWLLDSIVPDLLIARELAASIIGAEPGWTFSQMARNIIKWCGIWQQKGECRKLVPRWHCQYCLPGYFNHLTICDLSGAYWQFTARARSPIFDVVNEHIIWRSLTREQQTRWDTIIERCAPCKLLRLSIVGAASAGYNRSRENWLGAECWRGGVMQPPSVWPSPLQPLAMLVVRSTYEVTQLQADLCESVYTNADCCTPEGEPRMQYWDALGLQWRVKASGPGDVRALCAWQVGDRHTKPYLMYRDADAWSPHLETERLENYHYHNEVLQ